jgi:hypothetical protein
MFSMTRLMASATAMLALVTLSAVGADDVKTIDGGKGSAFKSKSYELKENGEIAVVLSLEAGKEVTVTTSGDKDTNVQLFVKSMYFEAKDTSPGPRAHRTLPPIPRLRVPITTERKTKRDSRPRIFGVYPLDRRRAVLALEIAKNSHCDHEPICSAHQGPHSICASDHNYDLTDFKHEMLIRQS